MYKVMERGTTEGDWDLPSKELFETKDLKLAYDLYINHNQGDYVSYAKQGVEYDYRDNINFKNFTLKEDFLREDPSLKEITKENSIIQNVDDLRNLKEIIGKNPEMNYDELKSTIKSQNLELDNELKKQIENSKEAIENTGKFNSNESKAIATTMEFYTAYGTNDDEKVKDTINEIFKTDLNSKDIEKIKTLTIKEMNMDLKESLDYDKEYTMKDINRKFAFEAGEIKLNQELKQTIDILGEKEKNEERIKAKEAELAELVGPKQKREYAKDKIDGVENSDTLKESLGILKEQEKLNEQIKAKEAELEKVKKGDEKEQETKQQPKAKENTAEQEDWNKRADELEKQHEKELEALKDKQARLEANFNKSIDNLMNSDGINGIITALQEMDKSLEMMMKQGKEESQAKDRQRQEKLELAFDSPKFKEAVSDLVKEVYTEHKKVKGGLEEMQKEHTNYVKLQSTYEKETKKGLDIKGYEKLKEMMGEINKETPNFKEQYPKFYKTVNDTLDQVKDRVLNKNKEQQKEQSRGL